MVVTATQQILSASGTDSLPILTCSVVENESIELLNQLRWVKGTKQLALTQESGTVTFDTASIGRFSTFPEESHFGTYRCEALGSQDKTEQRIHIAQRGILYSMYNYVYTVLMFIIDFTAQFSMQLQSLNDISCVSIPLG